MCNGTSIFSKSWAGTQLRLNRLTFPSLRQILIRSKLASKLWRYDKLLEQLSKQTYFKVKWYHFTKLYLKWKFNEKFLKKKKKNHLASTASPLTLAIAGPPNRIFSQSKSSDHFTLTIQGKWERPTNPLKSDGKASFKGIQLTEQ